MKIAIIISWSLLALALVFYFVVRYLAKKKQQEVYDNFINSTVNDGIDLSLLDQLLQQKGD